MLSIFPPLRPDLIVYSENDGSGGMVTSAIGALDASTSPTLQRHLETLPTVGRLDLRLVDFCSAAGVTVLSRSASGCEVWVSPQVAKVVSICDVGHHFRMVNAGFASDAYSFQQADFGMYLVDDDVRFRYVNPKTVEFHGLSFEQHRDRHPSEIFETAIDDCLPIIERVLDRRLPETHAVHARFDAIDITSQCTYHPVHVGITPMVAVSMHPDVSGATARRDRPVRRLAARPQVV